MLEREKNLNFCSQVATDLNIHPPIE
ncbi:Uncharacterised protein g1415 [Pycnogonum litorale]